MALASETRLNLSSAAVSQVIPSPDVQILCKPLSCLPPAAIYKIDYRTMCSLALRPGLALIGTSSPSLYPTSDTQHAFHNDTGQRYNPEQAEAAWNDTLAWLGTHLQV